MYEHFFQLNKKPFELTPNPDFLYLSKSHKKASTYLDYCLREKANFLFLTGEVGSGKTTLIRDLVKKLDGTVTLSMVFNTKVNSEQLLSMINEDFGLDSPGRDKVLLLKELNNFLIEEYQKGHQAVLIIDEAQNLSPDLLEEVRLLSNLEMDDSKLLQIILVGQPELEKVISLPELRQLRQRISIMCRLSSLTRTETEEYILHRLEVAGNRNAATFSKEAIDSLYAASKGVPRVVNIICNFLMLTAFTEETREVNADMVQDIVKDLKLDAQQQREDDVVARRRALLSALGAFAGHSEKEVRSPSRGEVGTKT